MTFLGLCFGFRGRIDRTHFWLGAAGLVAVNTLFAVPAFVLHALAAGDEGLYLLATVAMAVVEAALIWPSLAIPWKRLHDRGRSGWWLLALPLALIATHLAAALASGSAPAAGARSQILWALPAIGLWLWLLIECGVLPGTQGLNRYGPPPAAGGAA